MAHGDVDADDFDGIDGPVAPAVGSPLEVGRDVFDRRTVRIDMETQEAPAIEVDGLIAGPVVVAAVGTPAATVGGDIDPRRNSAPMASPAAPAGTRTSLGCGTVLSSALADDVMLPLCSRATTPSSAISNPAPAGLVFTRRMWDTPLYQYPINYTTLLSSFAPLRATHRSI